QWPLTHRGTPSISQIASLALRYAIQILPREKQMYRSRIKVSATAWFALVLLISSVSPAQRQTESQRERKQKEQAAAVDNATPATKNEDATCKGMKHRHMGPFRGGRTLTASG